MSNIKGVFFPYQVIPSKALGAFAAKTISDGVLEGCDISYAGTALAIGNGYFIACGRVMEISEDVSLAITGATSGYARVSVLVDTTKTSTRDTFEQVDFCVEYSATADGFASLYDENVNMDGTLYQMELCKVALSSAGITDIVSLAAAKPLGGISFERRWTNTYVNKEFEEQYLSLGLEDSDMYLITYVTGTSILAQKSVIAPVGKSARLDGMGAGTTVYNYVRTATYNAGGLDFGKGYKNGVEDNSVMIPARIYAIKGVLEI